MDNKPSSAPTQYGVETQLVHAGEPIPRHQGAVSLPIYQTSTFTHDDAARYEDIRYLRMSNSPNHDVLHDKLAILENGEAALVLSSGMAAISSALTTILSHGDHLLAQSGVYGGTHDFLVNAFPTLGLQVNFLDTQAASWEAQLKPNTKAIYVEAMTNPLLEVIDLKAIVAFARKHNILALIDATFASPINFRPLDVGFDLVIHSATKYLNGHSDIIAGAVIGSEPLIGSIREKTTLFGGVLDPHACFLLHRGLKTLALRVRHQNASALTLAQFLEAHPAIEKVYYPGLESHPAHGIAAELFDGYGGVLSFEPKGGVEVAQNLLSRLKLSTDAPSLGGVETLISRPAASSHAGLTPEARAKIGISDELIRLAVGIETTQDLIDDFAQALD